MPSSANRARGAAQQAITVSRSRFPDATAPPAYLTIRAARIGRRRPRCRSHATQLAVPNVKRLILDQQAKNLAVGRIDHGLSRLRVPVPALGIRQRPDLIETGQIGPQQPVWFRDS